uniref:hydroxymethylglutaryl-CoA reductase (NADPH) n=1 Tax=Caenorhabditis tropicalis TaxID=1561998 RepID=A0A1I7TPP5_9PELO
MQKIDQEFGRTMYELYVVSLSSDVKEQAALLWMSTVLTILFGIGMRQLIYWTEQSMTEKVIISLLLLSFLAALLYAMSDDKKLEDLGKKLSCDLTMRFLMDRFPEMRVLALSGNLCVDKKAAAKNWTEGRGRSVVAECHIKRDIVLKTLRTTPEALAYLTTTKLHIGSSRAGTVGGSNAHAANVVAAIFIATGQDAAQVVSSSMCSTRMEVTEEKDLYVSCTLPCIEVGTVGGGTILSPQRACLESLDCAGPNQEAPGRNAERLAEVIAATVLAGELSLMAALTTNDLVSSHMKLNRSKLQLYADETGKPTSFQREVEKAGLLTTRIHGKNKLKQPQDVVPCSNIL